MSTLGNQKGQVLLEYILLMGVAVSLMALVAKSFRDYNILATMTAQPWSYIRGMIEDGVWAPGNPSNIEINPTVLRRHNTPEGEL